MISDKSKAKFGVKAFVVLLAVWVFVSVSIGCVSAEGSLLFEASLRNGDYGAGTAIDTMDPYHGGSPHLLGIVDGPEGVTFTSTEADSRSNALINWHIANPSDRIQFRTHGTVSFMFKADRETHVPGEILGDNYGFGAFLHGQGAIGAYAGRIANDPGPEDDQVSIRWKTCDGSAWYFRDPVTLEYDRWYHLGFAWGGPENLHETWVCTELAAADSVGPIPWGVAWGTGSATNIGLGCNHERGYHTNYGSAAGVTFADIRIWDEYRAQGDTQPCDHVELPVAVDIKPTSCPNPLNVKSKGVLPVAILGTEDFDVTTIDPETIRLNRSCEGCVGVAPIRWDYEAVAKPFEGELCGCHELNDTYMDLTLKFDTQELVEKLDLCPLDDREEIPLIITGNLKEEDGGTPIEGEDCIWVLKPGKG